MVKIIKILFNLFILFILICLPIFSQQLNQENQEISMKWEQYGVKIDGYIINIYIIPYGSRKIDPRDVEGIMNGLKASYKKAVEMGLSCLPINKDKCVRIAFKKKIETTAIDVFFYATSDPNGSGTAERGGILSDCGMIVLGP